MALILAGSLALGCSSTKKSPTVGESGGSAPSSAAGQPATPAVGQVERLPDSWTRETLPPLSEPRPEQFEIMSPAERRQEYQELLKDMITGLQTEMELEQPEPAPQGGSNR